MSSSVIAIDQKSVPKKRRAAKKSSETSVHGVGADQRKLLCGSLSDVVKPVQVYDSMTPAERIVFHLCAAAVTAALSYFGSEQKKS